MNTRIQELFSRAGGAIAMIDGAVLTYTDHFDPKKFAELIVQECAEIAVAKNSCMTFPTDVSSYVTAGKVNSAKMIKQHFGVK